MKPNYMIVGAAKCATTSIAVLLGQHPDVFMVECKEPNFFCSDEIYSRGLDWYESLYESAGNKKMRGEASVRYSLKEVYPNTVSRIVSYAPDLKIIYMVRSPFSRIESLWLQRRSTSGEAFHYNFNTSVRINRDWLVDSSNYWQQINVYRDHFPDERILILFYEDFANNPKAIMRRCFEFLEVDPDAPSPDFSIRHAKTSGVLIPRNFLSRLRSYSTFRALVKLIPTFIREPLKKRLFFKSIQERPEWTPENRAWVADILEDDTREFLKHTGKPVDFWNLRA